MLFDYPGSCLCESDEFKVNQIFPEFHPGPLLHAGPAGDIWFAGSTAPEFPLIGVVVKGEAFAFARRRGSPASDESHAKPNLAPAAREKRFRRASNK